MGISAWSIWHGMPHSYISILYTFFNKVWKYILQWVHLRMYSTLVQFSCSSIISDHRAFQRGILKCSFEIAWHRYTSLGSFLLSSHNIVGNAHRSICPDTMLEEAFVLSRASIRVYLFERFTATRTKKISRLGLRTRFGYYCLFKTKGSYNISQMNITPYSYSWMEGRLLSLLLSLELSFLTLPYRKFIDK